MIKVKILVPGSEFAGQLRLYRENINRCTKWIFTVALTSSCVYTVMQVSRKGLLSYIPKQSNDLEYIVSFKGLSKNLEVKTQFCLPFSPHKTAKVLTSLMTSCNKGYLDNWCYWYLNLNEAVVLLLFICHSFIWHLCCSLILKLRKWIKILWLITWDKSLEKSLNMIIYI